MKQFIILIVALGAIAGIAGLSLHYVYEMTKDPIAQQNKIVEDTAKKEVLPTASSFEDVQMTAPNPYVVSPYWIGKDETGNIVGYVAKVKKQGYAADIVTIVGFTADGTITSIKIIQQSETPGLGAKCQDVVKNKETGESLYPFQDQYKTRMIGSIDVIKGPVPAGVNGISAITASTITSKAITDSINVGISAVMEDVQSKLPVVEEKKEGKK